MRNRDDNDTGTDTALPRKALKARRPGLYLVPGDVPTVIASQAPAPTSRSQPVESTGPGSAIRALAELGYAAEPLIDYRLQRRAVLRDLRRGSIGIYEVCDASPYLLRAARYFGEPGPTVCPVCPRSGAEPLWQVCFAYGDGMGNSAGQACGIASLPAMARRFGECEIYSVEVCQRCSWNHVLEKFLLEGRSSSEEQSGLATATRHVDRGGYRWQ